MVPISWRWSHSFSRFALSLFVVFGTTLSVFPSVIVLITSQYRCGNIITYIGQGFIILFEYIMMNTRIQCRSEPDNVWASTYFTPVSCFLLFNCGDYVGRILAGWVRWPGKVRRGNLLSFTYHQTKRRSTNISHPSVAGKGRTEPDFAVESFENRICSLVHVLQRCAWSKVIL